MNDALTLEALGLLKRAQELLEQARASHERAMGLKPLPPGQGSGSISSCGCSTYQVYGGGTHRYYCAAHRPTSTASGGQS